MVVIPIAIGRLDSDGFSNGLWRRYWLFLHLRDWRRYFWLILWNDGCCNGGEARFAGGWASLRPDILLTAFRSLARPH
jgi:hypothetical protein